MATVKIDLELEEDVAAFLKQGPQSAAATAREIIVFEFFRREAVSSGKAAQLLGMSRVDFLHRASDLKIPVISMSPEEWEAEKATVASWPKS